MESAINTFFYSLFAMIACGILLSCCPCLMPLIILVESFHYLQLCVKKLQSFFFAPFLLLLVHVSTLMYNTVLGHRGGAVMTGGWLGDELWVNDVVFGKPALPIQNACQVDESLPISKPSSPSSCDTPFIAKKPLRSRTATKVTVERLHELLIKALQRRDAELWVIESQRAKDKIKDKITEKKISNPSVQVKAIHKVEEVFKKRESSTVITAEEMAGDSAVKEAQEQRKKEEAVLLQKVTTVELRTAQPSTINHRLSHLCPRYTGYRFLPYDLRHWFEECALYHKKQALHNITEATQAESMNANSLAKFKITNRCDVESKTNFVKMEVVEDELRSAHSSTHISQNHPADTETTILTLPNLRSPESGTKGDSSSGTNAPVGLFEAEDTKVNTQNSHPISSNLIAAETSSTESYETYPPDVLQEYINSSNIETFNPEVASVAEYVLQVSSNNTKISTLVFIEPIVQNFKNEEISHSVSNTPTKAFIPGAPKPETMGICHFDTEDTCSQIPHEAKGSYEIPDISKNIETQAVATEFPLAEMANLGSSHANRSTTKIEPQINPSNGYIITNEPSKNRVEIASPVISNSQVATLGDANIGSTRDSDDNSALNTPHNNHIENGTPFVRYHYHSMEIDKSAIPLVSTNLTTYHSTSINDDTSYLPLPNANTNTTFLIPNTSIISSPSPRIPDVGVSTIQPGSFQQPLLHSQHTVPLTSAPSTSDSSDINMGDTGFDAIQQTQLHFYNSSSQITASSETNTSQTNADTTMDDQQVSAGQGLSAIARFDEDHSMADDATIQSGPTMVQQETDEEMTETSGEEATVASKATENSGADKHDEDMTEVEDAPGNLVNDQFPAIPKPGVSTNLSSAQGPSLQQTPSTPSPSAIRVATTRIHPPISTPTTTSATSLPFAASPFAGPSTPKNPALATALSTSNQKKRGRSDETASTPTTATTSRAIAPLRGAAPTISTPEVTLNEAEDEEEDWDVWSEDEADFPDGEINEEQEAQARAYEEAMLQEEEEDREYDRLFALRNKSQDGKRARQRRE